MLKLRSGMRSIENLFSVPQTLGTGYKPSSNLKQSINQCSTILDLQEQIYSLYKVAEGFQKVSNVLFQGLPIEGLTFQSGLLKKDVFPERQRFTLVFTLQDLCVFDNFTSLA